MSNAGRPKEDLSSLWEGWQDDVLDLYDDGGSDVEVKALIYRQRGSFSNDLWLRWIKEYPEFSETIRHGKMISNAWWEKQGRTNLSTSGYSYTGWYMNMRNRFGWKDKTEIDNTSSDGSMTPKESGKTIIKFTRAKAVESED